MELLVSLQSWLIVRTRLESSSVLGSSKCPDRRSNSRSGTRLGKKDSGLSRRVVVACSWILPVDV